MILLRRHILLKAYQLFDLMVFMFSFALAAWLSNYYNEASTFLQFFEIRVKVENLVIFLGLLLMWHMSFSLFGLYHSQRLSTRWSEIGDALKVTSVGTSTVLMAGILFNIKLISPAFLVVLWFSSSSVTILRLVVIRYLLGKIRACGRNLRHLLIVGTNPRAVRFVRKLESKQELGYRLIGFADENWLGINDFKKTGYELIADFQTLPEFLKDRVVDEVIVALPIKSLYRQASRIMDLCERQGIVVRFLSDLFQTELGRPVAEYYDGDALLSHYTGAMNGSAVLIKRTVDIVLSLSLLLLLAPLFFVTVALIKITSRGPVFFVQDRVGLHKRRFKLYKFRTMIVDAERKQPQLEHLNEASGPVFKIKNDPRTTPIGEFLRRASIDELPQLLNVLKGDMSIVGPRPLPIRDYNGFSEDWHHRRFSVKPGITCLWQINGRSSVPFEKWMKLDMEYIDGWSLWLDFKILVMTIPAVLRGSGAS